MKASDPYKTLKVKEETYSCVITVDPGITGSGFAAFHDIETNRGQEPVRPSATLQVVPKTSIRSWEKKCLYILEQFSVFLEVYKPDIVIVEFQEVYTSSKSQASALSGDLVKLTYLTGLMAGVVKEKTGKLPILVEPRVWNGQMSKDIVKRRIKRALKLKKHYSNHVADAVGIGLDFQGVL